MGFRDDIDAPDWAPGGVPALRHHSLAAVLERIGAHERRWPGLLAAALRREADWLDAATALDSTQDPRCDAETGPDADFDLEDAHHEWLASGGRQRKDAHKGARLLAAELGRRRHALRHTHPDGRPFTVAA